MHIIATTLTAEHAHEQCALQLNDAFNKGMAEHLAASRAAADTAVNQLQTASTESLSKLDESVALLADMASGLTNPAKQAQQAQSQSAGLASRQQTAADGMHQQRQAQMQPPAQAAPLQQLGQLGASAGPPVRGSPHQSTASQGRTAMPQGNVVSTLRALPLLPMMPAQAPQTQQQYPNGTAPGLHAQPQTNGAPATASQAQARGPPPPGLAGRQDATALQARITDALTLQDPDVALVPLCERLAPSAAAPALTDELRICVVQQLLSALSGGQRAPGQQEALLQWSAECVRGLQVCSEPVYRVDVICCRLACASHLL